MLQQWGNPKQGYDNYSSTKLSSYNNHPITHNGDSLIDSCYDTDPSSKLSIINYRVTTTMQPQTRLWQLKYQTIKLQQWGNRK